MNPFALKAVSKEEEIPAIPTPQGWMFKKGNRILGKISIRSEFGFPLRKVRISIVPTTNEGFSVKYFNYTLISFPPMQYVVKKRHAASAEILEFFLPPPFDLLTPPVLVHPNQSVFGRDKGWI